MSESYVNADPTQLHQVIMNLCTNAAHAMGTRGGVLSIKLSDLATGHIELVVSDTGTGIHQEILGRIFEPFFTKNKMGEGTGMGLAVVHGIVESHNGSISVESEVDQGTIFTVRFPIIVVESLNEVKVAQDPPKGDSERILVIDDEGAIVDMMKSMLENLGYDPVIESDSLQALELFRANPGQFDLVITDMTMPRMTGDKLARELMVIRPDIPIIICTGYSEVMSPEKAQEIGIREFILKPVAVEDLARVIKKVIQT